VQSALLTLTASTTGRRIEKSITLYPGSRRENSFSGGTEDLKGSDWDVSETCLI